MQQLIFHHSCVLIMVDFWGSVGYGVSELGGVGVTHEGCSLPFSPHPPLPVCLYVYECICIDLPLGFDPLSPSSQQVFYQ